ncbi:hypothetical protein IFM89_035450 [Coptis chinensis]|uniref:Uncharacterized protein n=1 Tax=Coptis chinensis TaxID=261450 RepID=A0A835IZD2_9MAGN|nr:hypothetical protein IFM89_035450 [Coptis chinensis]
MQTGDGKLEMHGRCNAGQKSGTKDGPVVARNMACSDLSESRTGLGWPAAAQQMAYSQRRT